VSIAVLTWVEPLVPSSVMTSANANVDDWATAISESDKQQRSKSLFREIHRLPSTG
jgi:hypothetical protein